MYVQIVFNAELTPQVLVIQNNIASKKNESQSKRKRNIRTKLVRT